MAASYPTAIKSFTTKVDGVTDILAEHINSPQEEIVAIQTELGTDPKWPNSICEGRLTLTSGTPVTTADVTAATTLYFTPYKGNRVALYDGTRWKLHAFTERSLSLSGLTANRPYDIFLYNNAGTLTLQAVAWTSGTARATALALQDGVYVQTGNTGRRYLGTICITATTGQCEDSAARRLVWNYAQRVLRRMYKADSTSHTYTTAAWRAWNNDSTLRIEFVVGVAEDAITFKTFSDFGGAAGAYAGGAMDAVSASGAMEIASTATRTYYYSFQDVAPQLGYHYANPVEYGVASCTFYRTTIGGMLLS